MTVLCSICSKHNLIPEGPLLSTLKFITKIKDTNNSSAKSMLLKFRTSAITRPVTAWSNRQRKEKCDFFFLFWLEEFHSIVLSILMKLN